MTTTTTSFDTEDPIYIPDEIQSLILSFLPILTLFNIKPICTLWNNLASENLNYHHSLFTSRVKLYAIILWKQIDESRFIR